LYQNSERQITVSMPPSPIEDLWKAMSFQSQRRICYSQTWIDLGKSLLDVIETTAPELISVIEQISGSFSKLGLLQRQLAVAESRSAEEFRDIFERQIVVQRVSNEYVDAFNMFKRASDGLAQAVTNKAKAQGQALTAGKERTLNSAIQAAVKLKEDASAVLKSKIQELIRQRERFVRFKERKIKIGFQIYVDHLIDVLGNEVMVMSNIEKLSSELNASPAMLPPEFRAYEEEFRSLVAARPPPVTLPQAEALEGEIPNQPPPAEEEEEEHE
jgi:CII-binding regulator of phage lambda lysogenization HflD